VLSRKCRIWIREAVTSYGAELGFVTASLCFLKELPSKQPYSLFIESKLTLFVYKITDLLYKLPNISKLFSTTVKKWTAWCYFPLWQHLPFSYESVQKLLRNYRESF
jgi:hypothetical protein